MNCENLDEKNITDTQKFSNAVKGSFTYDVAQEGERGLLSHSVFFCMCLKSSLLGISQNDRKSFVNKVADLSLKTILKHRQYPGILLIQEKSFTNKYFTFSLVNASLPVHFRTLN